MIEVHESDERRPSARCAVATHILAGTALAAALAPLPGHAQNIWHDIGLSVEVIADYGSTADCLKVLGVRRLPSSGPAPGWLVDAPDDLLVCVGSATRLLAPEETDRGVPDPEVPPQSLEADALRVGLAIEVWPQGFAFPTNPPKVVADRIRLGARAPG